MSNDQKLNGMKNDGRNLMFAAASLLGQTCLYGVFLSVLPSAMRATLRTRKGAIMNRIVFWIPLVTFIFSSAYLGLSIATFFAKIERSFVQQVRGPFLLGDMLNIFNAVMLLNFLLSETMVLWRAWVLCQGFRKSKPMLWTCTIFLFLAFGTAATTIVLRTTLVICEHTGRDCVGTIRPLEIIQLIPVGLFILNNIISTSVIAWRFRHLQKSGNSIQVIGPSDNEQCQQVSRTLVVIIESGALYGVVGLLTMALSFLRVSEKKHLGTFLLPVFIQFSSLYPAVVIKIVHRHRRETSDSQYATSVEREERPDRRSVSRQRIQSALHSRNGSSVTLINHEQQSWGPSGKLQPQRKYDEV
ncbi:hypothetical protein DL96DRAFT_1024995 [Flagelloscypha sp. PMI_526]|nr:hypothetical protein DL96DRAFT_1024995 [Flagelloscypha sp. PMI_526]